MRVAGTIFLLLVAFGVSALAQTQYYGAIDLGSKGVKAELFSFHRNDCPKEFMSRDSDDDFCEIQGTTINTRLVSSMKDGLFSDAGIQEAADAVKRQIDQMHVAAKTNQIAKVNYFIVGSSGVAKAKNKEKLVASVKAASGMDMEFIDAKREGYFGLIWAVTDPDLRAASIYVDVGSGNTKIGCLIAGLDLGSYRWGEIEYGSVSGRNKGGEYNPANIVAGIQQLMREEIAPAYEKASMDAPCLRNRLKIYWTGGAAWATATFTHPEKANKGAVRITKADIDAFLSRLDDKSWDQKPLQFTFSKDVTAADQKEIRETADKDRRKVMDTFVREDMLAGVSIMKTILGSSNPSAVVLFVRDSNYLFGYAKEKYGDQHAQEHAQSAETR